MSQRGLERGMEIHLPRSICGDVQRALRREWLVTNGIGGFAAGTIAGALTRRYHGLLIAALDPPLGRTLLAVKLDESAHLGGHNHQLYTNVWASGVEEPSACRYIRRFDLIWGVPTWTFAFGGATLIKRIWMENGRNATFVQYVLQRGSPAITLSLRLLVNDRDYHELARGTPRDLQVTSAHDTLEVLAPKTDHRLRASCDPPARGGWKLRYTTCRDFHLALEAARGFDHLEDHYIVGTCEHALRPGAELTFVLAADRDPLPRVRGALVRAEKRARARLAAFAEADGTRPKSLATPVRQLALAADQFIVTRKSEPEPDGHTVIAGYPWFTDWGRDTMIALPGLTLVTGRHAIARQILRTWARHLSQGVIPNRFPDAGRHPEYNTADATLWFLWAIDQYFRFTADVAALHELWPVMREVVEWHRRGTYHNIRVAADGLIYAGEPGVNLTWMDAKVGELVVTPRIGKPIELSALWHDACWNMARLADVLEQPGEEYARLAIRCRDSFLRFWNEHEWNCYDVLDGPGGHESACRPNQIFAVSLTHSPLARELQLAVVRAVEQRLHTWFGLRSLAPFQPNYAPRYVGGPVERDHAYHQGTAWGWLLGPYVIADYRVHKDRLRARRLLEPMLGHLWTHCVGQLSEVFDGDEPHLPNGCFAQAWTVGETLRAWWLTQHGATPAELKPPTCEGPGA
jgi:predicted glycogen debranching enzyme